VIQLGEKKRNSHSHTLFIARFSEQQLRVVSVQYGKVGEICTLPKVVHAREDDRGSRRSVLAVKACMQSGAKNMPSSPLHRNVS